MSKYTTGLHKGEDIMHVDVTGKHWSDHNNNVFIHDRRDINLFAEHGFCVSERLSGNVFHRWVDDVPFLDALELAERLVVGSSYVPEPRPEPTPEFNFEFGDIVCDNMHMHELHGEIAKLYAIDDSTRIEAAWLVNVWQVKEAPGKEAVLLGMSDEDIPEVISLGYKYDHTYFHVVARRRK